MKESEAVIAWRIAFLECELERMRGDAEAAERGLRLNPTDLAARRQAEAVYGLAGEIWAKINELRGRGGLIRYDHRGNVRSARSHRWALG